MSLCLSLPAPAFALRVQNGGLEEPTSTTQAIEDSLRVGLEEKILETHRASFAIKPAEIKGLQGGILVANGQNRYFRSRDNRFFQINLEAGVQLELLPREDFLTDLLFGLSEITGELMALHPPQSALQEATRQGGYTLAFPAIEVVLDYTPADVLVSINGDTAYRLKRNQATDISSLHGTTLSNSTKGRVLMAAMGSIVLDDALRPLFKQLDRGTFFEKLPSEYRTRAGLEERSGFFPEIIDGQPFLHHLDTGVEGTRQLSSEQAEFLRRFIQERLLDIGRTDPDPTMKQYLQDLVTDQDQPTTQKLKEKIRHDPSSILQGIGSASTEPEQVAAGREIISVASDLLGSAQRAFQAGRFSNDALELLAEVLLHEANHVLDVRDGRLDSWLKNVPDVARRLGIPPEQLEIHLKEMSGMGRTADVIGGSYLPDPTGASDPKKRLGGVFVYRYSTEPVKLTPHGTRLYPFLPGKTSMDQVRERPQTSKGASPWNRYFTQVHPLLTSGLEETEAALERAPVWVPDAVRRQEETITLLRDPQRIVDVVKEYMPGLAVELQEAGHREGRMFLMPGDPLAPASLESPQIAVYIHPDSDGAAAVKENLDVGRGIQLRFVTDPALAQILIGDETYRNSVAPDLLLRKSLLVVNAGTAASVTVNLLTRLQAEGYLTAGRVFTLYTDLENNTLLFA